MFSTRMTSRESSITIRASASLKMILCLLGGRTSRCKLGVDRRLPLSHRPVVGGHHREALKTDGVSAPASGFSILLRHSSSRNDSEGCSRDRRLMSSPTTALCQPYRMMTTDMTQLMSPKKPFKWTDVVVVDNSTAPGIANKKPLSNDGLRPWT